jgi:DNA-binding transcriptional regulator YdaS (Cro superfamily)
MISAIRHAYTKTHNPTSNEYVYFPVDGSKRKCIDTFMNEDMTRYEALVHCRDMAGSDSQMARDLGVTQPRVWRWINQTKQMPAEYVLLAEQVYGVSRHALRPDIYPREHHGSYPRWHGIDEDAQPVWMGYDPGREPRPLAVDQRVSGVSCERRAVLKRGAA